jgi:hypothetical protein
MSWSVRGIRHVNCGGCWIGGVCVAGVAGSDHDPPDLRLLTLGLRLVRRAP